MSSSGQRKSGSRSELCPPSLNRCRGTLPIQAPEFVTRLVPRRVTRTIFMTSPRSTRTALYSSLPLDLMLELDLTQISLVPADLRQVGALTAQQAA